MIKYEESFAYHVEVELGLNLDEVWNFEMNNKLGLDPYKIKKTNNKIKAYLFCSKNDYHNYDKYGNKIGYIAKIYSFYSGRRCVYCHGTKVHWKDSFAQYHIENTDPNFLEKYWNWEKNNELGINPWEIGVTNKKYKVWLYCQEKDYHNDFGGYQVTPHHFSYRNHRCSYCHTGNSVVHPKDSFAQWGIDEYGDDFLDKYWNWEKNDELGINPWKIRPTSKLKPYFFCQDYEYHNYDRNGNRLGYQMTCGNFYFNQRCSYCHKGVSKVHWMDSLAYNYPEIAKSIAIPKNNLTFEDCYNISCHSNNKRYYTLCYDCNNISKNKKVIDDLTRYGVICDFCSDKITFPNKVLRHMSRQLDLDIHFEYNEKWLNRCRLDGYDDSLKIAIEMDGCFGNHIGEGKKQDDWKDEQCLKHGIYVIRVDLTDDKEYSKDKIEYTKQQILNSDLKYIYDLDKIDWDKLFIDCQKSLVIESWELWNKGYSNQEVIDILEISTNMAKIYKSLGNKFGKLINN